MIHVQNVQKSFENEFVLLLKKICCKINMADNYWPMILVYFKENHHVLPPKCRSIFLQISY